MVRRVLSALFIFLLMATTASAAKTDDDAKKSFSERTSGMVQIKDVRFSTGRGTVRIVLDITKSVEYKVMYLDSPSRMVVDLQNAWLNADVKKTIEIKSTAASQIRSGQFDQTTVRIVINTAAENKIFELDGGPAGRRLVIDLGRAEPEPESAKPTTSRADDHSSDRAGERASDEPEDISKVPEGVPSLEPLEVDHPFEKPKPSESTKDSKDKSKDTSKSKDKSKDSKSKDKSRDSSKDASKSKDKSKSSDEDYSRPFSDRDLKDLLDDMTNLDGKKIAIDPGHGGNDSGAIGPTGVMEKTVTLRVALALQQLLEAEGAEVIMTRDEDTEVSPRGKNATAVEELKARCEVANRADADIFISIHADSFTNPNARGTTGYYYSLGSKESRRLADLIRSALIEQIRTPSRGTQPCNFYVVRNTDMPATLIELAFISNPDEEKLLNSKEGIQKAALGILDGIEDYFG